jgi:hypothetical protein
MAKVIPIRGENKDKIRLPGTSDRIAIIGHTGSGKSQAALWHLSNVNFDRMPWIIVDPKEEEKINSIEGATYIENWEVPKKPGIYILPTTRYDLNELDEYFAALLDRQNVGVYIDEGSECGFGPGFETFLTRGRSRHCPAIVLTQRPINISRYAFSEAQFFQCFPITDERDYKVLRGMAKIPNFDEVTIPQFSSFYYDVRWKRCYFMHPVPKIDAILDRIETRLEPLTETRKVRYM